MDPTAIVGTAGVNQILVYKLFTPQRQAKKFLANSLTITVVEEEQKLSGTQALLHLVKIAEKNKWERQKDLAQNHDKYFIEIWRQEKYTRK